jgi:PAS domain-containing protein
MAFQMKALIDDLLLKSISDMGESVFILDLPRVVYSNEAFQKLSGYSDRQLGELSSFLLLVSNNDRSRVERTSRSFRRDTRRWSISSST